MSANTDSAETSPRLDDDHYGTAMRLAGAQLKDRRRGRRKGKKASDGPAGDDDLVTALNTIAQALERPIPNGKRHVVAARATALLVRVIGNGPEAQPGVTAPESIRAGFARVLRAVREGHPTGPAAILVAGLAFKTNRAAMAFVECLLGTSDGTKRLVIEVEARLPGRDSILFKASSLWPSPDPRLDTLRLSAVRAITGSGCVASRLGVELHRLTSVKTIVEAGHSAANQVGPAGLDGIAEAIIDAWPRTNATTVHETLREVKRRAGTILTAPGLLATTIDLLCRYAVPRAGWAPGEDRNPPGERRAARRAVSSDRPPGTARPGTRDSRRRRRRAGLRAHRHGRREPLPHLPDREHRRTRRADQGRTGTSVRGRGSRVGARGRGTAARERVRGARSGGESERARGRGRGRPFPTTAMSKVFRGKYLDSLTTAHRSAELRMPGDDGVDDTRAFE